MPNLLLAAVTLWRREIVRFYRQPGRVFGALASPVLFWVVLGSGIGSSFQAEGREGYLGYFFPGMLLLILFFTSIFSTISLIEDRREGFLQSVLVAPVPRAGLALGKILGGATLSFFQASLMLCFAPLLGIHLDAGSLALAAICLFMNGFLLTALGFIFAWRFRSIQGFHAVMNLVLMPMWMLSGALFPAEGASPWIRVLMRINPLSYGLQALQAVLLGEWAGFGMSLAWTSVFAVALFVIAVLTSGRSRLRDLT